MSLQKPQLGPLIPSPYASSTSHKADAPQSTMDRSNQSGAPRPHSSPDCRPVDYQNAILEEEEDETSSEALEPLTPTSDTHHFDVHDHDGGDAYGTNGHALGPVVEKVETKLPAPRLPPVQAEPQAPSPTATPRPGAKRLTSKRLISMFTRTQSHVVVPKNESSFAAAVTSGLNGVAQNPSPPRRLSSFSLSARNSPRTSKSNSPPSPGSPTETVDGDRPRAPPGPVRTSTGFSIHERFSQLKFNVPKPQRPARQRSTSMTGATGFQPDNSISMHAATGVGLKARRLSTSLPDDFTVDVVELNEEFTSTSIVPGRRGKLVGTGATASVKLMARKGGSSDQVFAVKEFRKKAKHESEDEYVKKVKSEFSIARSLHHPNIVESVRLCTHNGRWNHVMEYCPQGELFSLVQRGYLEESDRLCLFKQLLRGVAYLHAHGIAHRDLKLENLLVDNSSHLKITDFGVSEVFCGVHPGLRSANGQCGKDMKECRRSAPGICGSLPYIAPEVLEKRGDYDPRPLDVWSCALAYIVMRFKGSPWPAAERTYPQYDKFIRGWEAFYAKHPDQLITDDSGLPRCGELFGHIEPLALKRVLLRMMHPVPEKRIGIHEALHDRWVKTIECCGLDESGAAPVAIDASDKRSCARSGKCGIRKLHNHLPPAKRVLVHPFEFKDS